MVFFYSAQLWSCELKAVREMMVGGTVATWSTGYALEVTARIPSTAPAIRMNILGFNVGIAIFLNTFLMSLFLLIAKCCKRQW
ncbi:hypothetical protein TSMEX_006829 [Taenia solium]|eukprot:TsM_000947900 transcript=TsM_000947900 gene=TsM_000947900